MKRWRRTGCEIAEHPAVVGFGLIVNKGDRLPIGTPTGRRYDNKDGKWIVRDYYKP